MRTERGRPDAGLRRLIQQLTLDDRSDRPCKKYLVGERQRILVALQWEFGRELDGLLEHETRMGLVFVLLLWLLALGCAGIPVAGALAGWSWLNNRRHGGPWKLRALAASTLPFVLINVGLAWFVSYALIAGRLGWDTVAGDEVSVPLANGYTFRVIDQLDQGYLKDGRSGAKRVGGITRLTQCGNFVAGYSKTRPFLFDTVSGVLSEDVDDGAIAKECGPSVNFEPTSEFYRKRRFGWFDLAALAAFSSMAIPTSVFWYRRFIRNRQG